MENLFFYEIATGEMSEMYCMAFIIVREKDLITFRDALQPHRAVVAK
jgi:hypothetical protein